MTGHINGLIVSDFNAGNLVASLNRDNDSPAVSVTSGPFGQVSSPLLDGSHSVWASCNDFVVVWTRPETAIPSFEQFVNLTATARDDVFKEVDALATTLINASRRTRLLLVPSWEIAPYHMGHGPLDLSRDIGASRLLLEMNLRLLKSLDGNSGIQVLNSRKWFQLAGQDAFNPRLWYLGKIPFSNSVFNYATGDIKASLRSMLGKARKLLIVDLDETLWGGVVGDVGWNGIQLGGHDPIGEALVDFQRDLKALAKRGVMLAIVSKNDEQVAIKTLSSHPEMILRPADFVGWRINWKDKSDNIIDLISQLNVGLDSVVFIDDNPVERARVHESLPDVLVPEWPGDKRLYSRALLQLDCFSQVGLTAEDRNRRAMYAAETERGVLKGQTQSLDEWFRSLQMKVFFERVNDTNRSRALQLLNKTNQMNLSTRRFTERELSAWTATCGNAMWTFRLSDRFGDAGLIGIASICVERELARIEDFVLSCRVMGRQVEATMLHVMTTLAGASGAATLDAVYKQTAKNSPCLEFFRRSGLNEVSPHRFVWSLDVEYPSAPHIELDSQTTLPVGAVQRLQQ